MELEGEKERREMERKVELVFGSGQWQCVGRRIAFMELTKVVFEVSLHVLPKSLLKAPSSSQMWTRRGRRPCHPRPGGLS